MAEQDSDALAKFVEERHRYGFAVGAAWGHFYQMTAEMMMLERPDYAQEYRKGISAFMTRLGDTRTELDPAVEATVVSLQHLPIYIILGWETGIYNEFRHFQSRGVSRSQVMELVLYASLSAGWRGLQHVYNAVGRILVDFSQKPGPAPFPKTWAPDPDAFKAGLDLSTNRLTDQDRKNLTGWFEQTIGYLPKSVRFALKYHPDFYKGQRRRWEVIFKTLPKQAAPYIMLREHLMTGREASLRDAVLLGKAWGVGKEWTIHGLTASAWYTGFDALEAALDGVEDILDLPDW